MVDTDKFNSEDQTIIQSFFLNHKSLRANDIHDLVNSWEKIVKDISDGYRLTIYDYTNDLTIRNFFYEIRQLVSDDGINLLDNATKLSDQQFIEHTNELKKPIYGPPSPEMWWFYRIPKRLIGELREDLISNGIVNE